MDSLDSYSIPDELVWWALGQFNIDKPPEELDDIEIGRITRWLGLCAYDSYLVEGKPILNRGGINLMLTISLLVFPEFYQRHELSQFN